MRDTQSANSQFDKEKQLNITADSFYMNILAIHEDVDIHDGGIDLPRIDGPNDNWKRFNND